MRAASRQAAKPMETQRKSAFIATSRPHSAVGESFAGVAGELSRKGFIVHLLVPKGQERGWPHSDGVLIHAWPSNRPIHLQDALFLRRLILDYKPAIFAANFGAVNLMTLLGWLYGVPVRVVWYHTLTSQMSLSGFRGLFLMKRKALVYRFATHFACVSIFAKSDLVTSYKVPADMCHVAYNCLRDPKEDSFGQPPRYISSRREQAHVLFICVARLDPSKGVTILIEALHQLQDIHQQIQVHFIGDGPARPRCEALIDRYGLKAVVTLHGALPHAEVLNAIAQSDCLILPSLSEAFGVVLIEAMAFGKPVIATRVGGIPEIVKHDQVGLLIEPNSPAALALAIRTLASDGELRAQLGRCGRQAFLERFEFSATVEKTADWLNSLQQK